jgi:hypothetical protein
VACDAQQTLGDARADHMEHQQQRDAEAKAELPPFPARKPQIAPHVNRPQRIQIVRKQGRRQNGGSDCAPPRIHEDVEGCPCPLEGNEQEAVRR